MNRARYCCRRDPGAALLYAGAALAAQATTPVRRRHDRSPLVVLAGKKFTPPIQGEAPSSSRSR